MIQGLFPSVSVCVCEFLFADDAAAVGTSRRSMERAASILKSVISEWGLVLSIPKNKAVGCWCPLR